MAQDDVTNRTFLGGPAKLFDRAGREQLIVLLEHGLSFSSTVLDIGCGVLRGGRWIIPLLEPGHYCGIEPQRHMVERGLAEFVDQELVERKRPRFDHNDRFDFTVFDMAFTHFVARSIWTHAAKPQIEAMLDGVAATGEPGAVLLASYLPASVAHRRSNYRGVEWVGRSHESERAGMVAHSAKWVAGAARERGLEASPVNRPPLTPRGQVWLAIRKPG